MKLKIAFMMCFMMLALTGCFSEENSLETTPVAIVPSQNGPKPDSAIYTSDDVKQNLEQQGFQVAGAGNSEDDWILNGIKPENYYLHCSPSTDCKKPQEHLSVYIFKSKVEQEKGFADFNKQKDQYNMIVPVVWAKTNALVLYWHTARMDQKPVDEEKISQALVGWEKISQYVSNEVATSSSCEKPPKVLEWSGQTYHLKAESSTLEPGMKFGFVKCDKGKFSLGDADNSYIVYSVGDPRTNSDILFRGQWGFALYSLDTKKN